MRLPALPIAVLTALALVALPAPAEFQEVVYVTLDNPQFLTMNYDVLFTGQDALDARASTDSDADGYVSAEEADDLELLLEDAWGDPNEAPASSYFLNGEEVNAVTVDYLYTFGLVGNASSPDDVGFTFSLTYTFPSSVVGAPSLVLVSEGDPIEAGDEIEVNLRAPPGYQITDVVGLGGVDVQPDGSYLTGMAISDVDTVITMDQIVETETEPQLGASFDVELVLEFASASALTVTLRTTMDGDGAQSFRELLDFNQDGKLTSAELRQFQKAYKDEQVEAFAKEDLEMDGKPAKTIKFESVTFEGLLGESTSTRPLTLILVYDVTFTPGSGSTHTFTLVEDEEDTGSDDSGGFDGQIRLVVEAPVGSTISTYAPKDVHFKLSKDKRTLTAQFDASEVESSPDENLSVTFKGASKDSGGKATLPPAGLAVVLAGIALGAVHFRRKARA